MAGKARELAPLPKATEYSPDEGRCGLSGPLPRHRVRFTSLRNRGREADDLGHVTTLGRRRKLPRESEHITAPRFRREFLHGVYAR
jgi:hypothetical protein